MITKKDIEEVTKHLQEIKETRNHLINTELYKFKNGKEFKNILEELEDVLYNLINEMKVSITEEI
jgi:hypothetical protein